MTEEIYKIQEEKYCMEVKCKSCGTLHRLEFSANPEARGKFLVACQYCSRHIEVDFIKPTNPIILHPITRTKTISTLMLGAGYQPSNATNLSTGGGTTTQ